MAMEPMLVGHGPSQDGNGSWNGAVTIYIIVAFLTKESFRVATFIAFLGPLDADEHICWSKRVLRSRELEKTDMRYHEMMIYCSADLVKYRKIRKIWLLASLLQIDAFLCVSCLVRLGLVRSYVARVGTNISV